MCAARRISNREKLEENWDLYRTYDFSLYMKVALEDLGINFDESFNKTARELFIGVYSVHLNSVSCNF